MQQLKRKHGMPCMGLTIMQFRPFGATSVCSWKAMHPTQTPLQEGGIVHAALYTFLATSELVFHQGSVVIPQAPRPHFRALHARRGHSFARNVVTVLMAGPCISSMPTRGTASACTPPSSPPPAPTPPHPAFPHTPISPSPHARCPPLPRLACTAEPGTALWPRRPSRRPPPGAPSPAVSAPAPHPASRAA